MVILYHIFSRVYTDRRLFFAILPNRLLYYQYIEKYGVPWGMTALRMIELSDSNWLVSMKRFLIRRYHIKPCRRCDK